MYSREHLKQLCSEVGITYRRIDQEGALVTTVKLSDENTAIWLTGLPDNCHTIYMASMRFYEEEHVRDFFKKLLPWFSDDRHYDDDLGDYHGSGYTHIHCTSTISHIEGYQKQREMLVALGFRRIGVVKTNRRTGNQYAHYLCDTQVLKEKLA